jgi:DNA modification methylase
MAKQLNLPTLEELALTSNGNNAYFNDPAFANNKTLPIHRWVPWIAGFSSNFVKDAVQRYTEGKATILDPFAGVGTTLVEATLLGHNVYGFEINPYAALACRVKVNSYQVDVEVLYNHILQFKQFYNKNAASNYIPSSQPPRGFKSRSAFYSPKVLRKVLILQDFINLIQDEPIKELFKLAFTSTMVSYSNYSYEPSLGRRVSAGKDEILDYSVGETILAKLAQIREDIKWFQIHKPARDLEVKIVEDSFFNYKEHLASKSVDLIITSPPYLNNYHYNRNTRPHLYWLGYAQYPENLRTLEESNFGKYWQTVREENLINLEFHLPDTDLAEKLEFLRKQRPERGIYGGHGWANYAASYFNDCYKFALGIQYVLRPGGTALVVIGNSILQGILISTDQYFGQIAETVGLELVRIDIPRATRVGNSIIQSKVRSVQARKSHQLYEAIVELRKS